MCGIFGYFIKKGSGLDASTLQAMGEILKHRGPDDRHIFSDSVCALGNTRLSVLDVVGGQQPFISEDNQIIVVQNGEIFNYIEWRTALKKEGYFFRTHSDTEVILRLYQRYGIDFIKHLNGMFSIAIYDKRKNSLFLIRDRLGIKPLYFYEDDNRILFASEIKSLLCAGIKREVNYQALHHFLSFNYVPVPYTLFKGVESALPGHYLKITKESRQQITWWSLANIETEQRSEMSWITEFNETLKDAVRLRLRADVPYGAFLSGGLDSSTIVGLMAANAKDSIQTYAIGFEEPAYNEAPYAEYSASKFSTRHTLQKVNSHILNLWPLVSYYCDQPHGDVSFIPTYCVSKLASKDVKVVLTGEGGDELFAGYDRYVDFFSSRHLHQSSQEKFNLAYFENMALFSNAQKKLLYQPSMQDVTQDLD